MSVCRLWLEEMRVGWLVQGFLQGLLLQGQQGEHKAPAAKAEGSRMQPVEMFCLFAAFPSALVVRPASRETAQLRRSHATHCPKLRTNELSLSRPLRAITAGNMIGAPGVFPEGGIVGFSWSCSPEIPCRLFRIFRVSFLLFVILRISLMTVDLDLAFAQPHHQHPAQPPTRDPNSRIEATGSGRVARARSTLGPAERDCAALPLGPLGRWRWLLGV